MWWIAILVVLAVAVAAIILGSRPMNIPRDQDRELAEDEQATRAYDRVSRWPIFGLERYIVLKALAEPKPHGWLVDLGCGPGHLVARIVHEFPDVKTIGLDVSKVATTIARHNSPADVYFSPVFVVADGQQLPFSESSVDLVVSSLSLHHWRDAEAVFREIGRVLKPGGRFLIFDLRRDAPSYFYYALKMGQAFLAPQAIRQVNGATGSFWAAYTPSEIEKAIAGIGVDNLQIKSQFGWMLVTGSKPRSP
jgi:ubiquinone/menaquinone biosynthesis C-methylase UbiE